MNNESPDRWLLALIKREGYLRLSYANGCYCGSFRVAAFDVHISCHKGTGVQHGTSQTFTVHVYWMGDEERDMDAGCVAIGEEIARQCQEFTCFEPVICLEHYNNCLRKVEMAQVTQ